MKAKDMRGLSVFENHGARNIREMWQEASAFTSEVRRKVLGAKVQPPEEAVDQKRLRWLRRTSHMPAEATTHCALYFDADSD